MRKNVDRAAVFVVMVLLASLQFGMARRGQYDEEAREAERAAKQESKSESAPSEGPLRGIAHGVKQATVDSTTGLVAETAESTKEEAPVMGTLEGVRQGSEKVVDNTVKGVFKVATLGYGDVKEVKKKDPESGSGEPTKFSINW